MSFKMAGKFNGCFDINNASLQLNNTDNIFFLFFFFYSATVTPPKRRIMFLINNVGR